MEKSFSIENIPGISLNKQEVLDFLVLVKVKVRKLFDLLNIN
tara:strand:- start:306 stop:431 length:126 start_codon:yes stop_codon:yes gene_type:complete